MANTGRISGKDLYVTLNAIALHGDFTSVSVSDEADLVDVTAGADTYHYFLELNRRNQTLDFSAYYDGSTTTVWDGVAPNANGTLIVAPKGTTAGNPCWTWTAAVVQSRSVDMPFDGGVTVSATIQCNALVSETSY